MQLPIDASKRNYKPKYLTEETRELAMWFVFGTHPDGTVDVVDPFGDVLVKVPPEMAARLIKARDAFCQAIEEELCRFPRLE